MGIVYEAVHADSGLRVALKTAGAVNRKMLASLRAEVVALRRVKHPNVVAILDEGLSEAVPWYAMDLVIGETLAEFNRGLWPGLAKAEPTTTTTPGLSSTSLLSPVGAGGVRPVPEIGPWSSMAKPNVASGRLEQTLTIYRLLCEPLAHVHAQGIVHRDVKPSNVVLRADTTPVLMDFGLASRAFGSVGRDELDLNSRFLGSVPYVSPEQIRGEFVDARADLYSLGCMLYETLTGRRPFAASSARGVLDMHLHDTPVPPSTFAEGISPALDRLVVRLLAKKARDRIGHADDLATELRNLGSGTAPPDIGLPSSLHTYLYRPELVGRTKQLDEIRHRRNEAFAGRGGLIVAIGESGIGKTFLAAEVARQAALNKFNVAIGECVPVATDPDQKDLHGGPLHPFRRLLQAIADRCREGGAEITDRLLGHRGKLLAQYEPALAGLPGQERYPEPQPLPPEAARRRTLSALQDVLRSFAAEAPLLLILDDLQWADELSLSFLEALPDGFFAGSRLLLFGLSRSEETGARLHDLLRREDVTLVKVERLDQAALEAMISDMLAMPRPPPAFVQFLWKNSEGNPFFAAEYLRVVVTEGLVQRRAGTWVLNEELVGHEGAYEGLRLPRSIEELIGRRLRGLGATERGVVEAAAVLGREFEDQLLTAVSGEDEATTSTALRELVTRDVLEALPGGRHRFAHESVRAVAYGAIVAERRQELHGAAGLALESRHSSRIEQHFAELAQHFKQAHHQEKTLEYLEKAAYQALSRFANAEAEQFFRELLERAGPIASGDPSLSRARWERGLGDALHGRGAFDEARKHLEAAAALLNEPLPRGSVRMASSLTGQLFRQVLHRVVPKAPVATDARELVRAREASQVYDRLLQIFYYRGLPQEMFYATLKTLNLAELAGPSPELATAYSIAHAVAGIMPIRSLADSYLDRANRVLLKTPDPAVVSYLHLLAGVYRSGTAEWERARKAFDDGLALARSLGFDRRVDEISLGLANWNFLQGRFSASLDASDLHAATSLRGDPQAQAWKLLMRLQAHIALATSADAKGLEDAERLIPSLQRSELIWTYSLLAAHALRSEAFADARAYADRGLEQILAGPPVTFYCIEAYAAISQVFLDLWQRSRASQELAATGLPAQAQKANSALKAFARVFPAARPRWAVREGLRLDLLGRRPAARQLWRRSLTEAIALKMPYDEAVGEWMVGRSLSPGQEERAFRLARGLQVARELRARSLEERIQVDVAS